MLTLVELSGLLLVIFIGFYAITQGNADFDRVVVFEQPERQGHVLRGDRRDRRSPSSRWSASRTRSTWPRSAKDPVADFPKMMLTGLGITGVIYVLVAITAVALVPVGDLTDADEGAGADPGGRRRARPNLPFDTIFPFIGMFAVANSALINMLMASRLLYGMANQDVLPRASARCTRPVVRRGCRSSFTTAIAVGLIVYVVRANASRGRHRKRRAARRHHGPAAAAACSPWSTSRCWCCARTDVDHDHFRTPTLLPVVGAFTCAFLAGPWARSEEQLGAVQDRAAACWPSASCCGRSPGSPTARCASQATGFRDVDHLE